MINKFRPRITATVRENGAEKEVISGQAVDSNVKTGTPVNVVGVNLGVTMNMGNYQSMRIDIWGTSKVRPKETRKKAIFRLSQELSEALGELQTELVKG